MNNQKDPKETNSRRKLIAGIGAAWSGYWDYVRDTRLGKVCKPIYGKPVMTHEVSRTKVSIYPDGKGKVIHFIRKEPYYEFNPQVVEVEYVQMDNPKTSK